MEERKAYSIILQSYEKTAKTIPEFGFYLNHVFPYKDRIIYSVTENTSLRKPVFSHILRSVSMKKIYYKWMNSCEYMDFR